MTKQQPSSQYFFSTAILVSHVDAAHQITIERAFNGSPQEAGRQLALTLKRAQEDSTTRVVSYFGEDGPIHIVVTHTTLNSETPSEAPVEFSIV